MKPLGIFFVNGCKDIRPVSLEEKVVWVCIVLTYPLYMIGGLYIIGSIMPWLLTGILLIRCLNHDKSKRPRIEWPLWMWCACMLIMQVALVVGHLDFNFGFAEIVKSSIGWAKGWASLALFPLASALRIRPRIIFRACCIVAMQSIIWYAIATIAYTLKAPAPIEGSGELYISPLKILGGSGDSFFKVTLYEIDPENQVPRFRFFAPWSPACGMVSIIYLMASLRDKSTSWKILGVIGTLLIVLGTKSRVAFIAYFGVPITLEIITLASRPIILYLYSLISLLFGIFFPIIKNEIDTAVSNFRSQRAGSSRVREVLGDIGLYRWRTEAPIWGHGKVVDGPKVVESMPIGSHHTWIGLLYVKGLVGFVAFLIPMVISTILLVTRTWNQKYKLAPVGLGILLAIYLYTFAENMETLIYIYWPGAIVLGMALNEKPKTNIN